MRQIRGKTALVTGAASGIGRALALALAKEGARLYLLDIDFDGLKSVVAEVETLGVEAVGKKCDLSDGRQISAAVQFLLGRWGELDILVNNAGLTYYGRTSEMSADNWDRLLAVNLLAPLQLTRELLPTLLRAPEAHVVNMASVLGLVGLARVAAYSTSKYALVGFTESMRAEYVRRGVGFSAICPGLVDTNLFAAAPRAPRDAENRVPPRLFLTTPESIARRTIRAIYKNQGVVVVQPYARALYLVKRLAPGLLEFCHRARFKRRRPQHPSANWESRIEPLPTVSSTPAAPLMPPSQAA